MTTVTPDAAGALQPILAHFLVFVGRLQLSVSEPAIPGVLSCFAGVSKSKSPTTPTRW